MDKLDAHLHLWQLAAGRYSWLGPQHGAIHRSFGADEAASELAAAGIGRAVLVQSEDSIADTEYLLETAASTPWVAGVVGWLPLEHPRAVEGLLGRWLGTTALCGVRQLVHDDPRDGFLALPAVRESLQLLASHGVPFDVPDAWPRHLAATAELAEALPALTVVVDHLAKPPLGRADLARWEAQLRRVAAAPNTVAKVSGLHLAGRPYTAQALAPVWELALELFGPERLMYGGDWPVSLLGAPYGATHAVLATLIGRLGAAEQEQLWTGTARRVYRLSGKGT